MAPIKGIGEAPTPAFQRTVWGFRLRRAWIVAASEAARRDRG